MKRYPRTNPGPFAIGPTGNRTGDPQLNHNDNYYIYVQENTDPSKICVNRNVPVASGGLYGGETLDKTASFAIKALQAVAYNVGVLAEDLESRMERLAQDLDEISEEVGYLGLKVEMGEERQARKQIRKLTVKKNVTKNSVG